MKRRDFLVTSGAAVAGSMLVGPFHTAGSPFPAPKRKLALVGTGSRGNGFWGRNIVRQYGDLVEFVGLCDINPGRVEYAKKFIGANCPTFTNFDDMMAGVKPDLLIVTTVDATHDEFIIKGLESGCDVLTEKPMTTDEVKCQAILDAERRTGKKVIVGFNYRYGTQFTRIKELLAEKRVGEIVSVDFHWYLNTYHGADYFRRWHGHRNKSGTLLLHKATHHFDLLNWWLNSDPVEVHAIGSLDHYGKNNSFRGPNCRSCGYQEKCKFYWDITKNKEYMELYVNNEKYDGYIRDNCLWRESIDIFDKMALQIKYANNVHVSYSLTTYSPYEGLTIGFNGRNGRIDSWEGLPWRRQEMANQAELHAREMSQEKEESTNYDEIYVSDNFGKTELVKVPQVRAGHGGGDVRLQDKIFRNPGMTDPLKHAAGTRDGAMSLLIGVAARKSIDEGRPVKIEELTDIKPHPSRG
ncbi:MAG TPA: Gfo/Idh/MocA family oxidoreductase [Prolixibacteraceae bacterium]|nr:Gfo/Idh/MocA family oxidoreductase [Prolixibacteraceae bacterium]HPV18462.1 Gfo/Idh/MocA family oxidoreductase [Prolixibacteraceae bacterium]